MNTKQSSRVLRNLRGISQAAFLLIFLFLFLQTESKGNDTLGYPVKVFLDFDPLIFTTTILSAHAVTKAFFLSIVLILVTVLLGRVFCGWACPFGTIHNIVGLLGRKKPHVNHPGWHRVKYYILLFLLLSSLFTLQLAGIMDPLSLLIRSLSVSVNPPFNYGTRAFFDAIFNTGVREVTALSEPLYSLAKKGLLSFQQPRFRQGTGIGLLFIFTLLLNLYEKRFWCRYLCPLGAFLGLLSGYSLLKRSVSEGCTSCGACTRVCQGDAAPDIKEGWKHTECYYCWNCDDVCPQNAVHFGFGRKREAAALDLGRRRVVASMLTGVVSVPLLRSSPLARGGYPNPVLVRPPGSLEEKEFLKRCVKCGECMKVCITNGLQPALFEAGLEGIWSPVLVSRIGYCEYRCTLCGQVCPTGAIRRLGLEEKAKVRIGLAMIDKGRCLPYAYAVPCIVCEEVCPTPKKAIWLERAVVRDRQGREIELKQPKVDLDLCIGCGICEAKCPVIGQPAIYVISTGESRSKENRLLL